MCFLYVFVFYVFFLWFLTSSVSPFVPAEPGHTAQRTTQSLTGSQSLDPKADREDGKAKASGGIGDAAAAADLKRETGTTAARAPAPVQKKVIHVCPPSMDFLLRGFRYLVSGEQCS